MPEAWAKKGKGMPQIKLGTKVIDTVTGFTGTATSRIEYMTGCTQYGVAPRVGADGILCCKVEPDYRSAVADFLATREDRTLPEDGWSDRHKRRARTALREPPHWHYL